MSIHFKWTDEISVGDEIIDSHHKKLLEQVNKIMDAIVFGVEKESVKNNILDFLDNYIEEHFSYEEEYMKNINYPGLKGHIKKHHNFIKTFNKIKDNFEKGGDRDEFLSKIEKYVGAWWINHIGKEDKKYQLFLEAKNKRIK